MKMQAMKTFHRLLQFYSMTRRRITVIVMLITIAIVKPWKESLRRFFFLD